MPLSVKVPAVMTAVGVAAWGWMAAASAIYCYGYGIPDKFRFPFMQWLHAARWWDYSDEVTLWVSIGALIPTAFLALVCLAVFRTLWSRRGQKPVYGETDWATRPQMKANRIATTRRPF